MSEYILWVFLLAIWNVFLFFSRDLGINVILFILPLLFFMYYVLKNNKKINYKLGLIYIIPIILLSITYMIFDNSLFRFFNCISIPILIGIFLVITRKGNYNLSSLVNRVIETILLPLTYIDRLYRVTFSKTKLKFKMSDKTSKICKSLLIVIPVTLVVIALLSSADMIFDNIFGNILEKILNIFKYDFFDKLLGRIIMFIIMYTLIGTSIMYILFNKDREYTIKKQSKDLLTTKVLLSVLNVIYVIFDFIQIKSLMLHSISSNIDYASYARQGFFELLFVSLINLSIILISRKFENKDNTKEFKYIKIMDTIMIFLTIIIIISSFIRMHMYEMEYGYTTLRLLVFASLITETILMIPTIMYIFNDKVNIVRSYIIILLIAYLSINFINIDYVIARRNINRYYIKNDIDIGYLENYDYDNIPLLIDLYNKLDDKEIKDDLNNYLYNVKEEINDKKYSIFEYNYSYIKAKKVINKYTFNVDYSIYE